jgi:hypothetical protein
MRFHRFTQLGFISNWGWYSPAEQGLLDKEDELGRYLASLEDFVRCTPSVKRLLLRFKDIQSRDDVKTEKYGALQVELGQMLDDARRVRFQVLDRGGDDIPDAPKTFPNHQPAALVGEIRSFLEYRKLNRSKQDPFHSGFVIHFHSSTAEKFKAAVDTGSKLLYTLDVDGILSIGDPKSTKHSVVAVGMECKAAGIAQLDIDDRLDVYKSMKYLEELALNMQNTIAKSGDPGGGKQANVDCWNQQAQELHIQLAGYVPPLVVTHTILLDFDSGHYAPSNAWKEAMSAWKTAGYTARWNPESRRV